MPTLRRARDIGDYLTDANLGLLDATAQFLGGLKLAMSQDLQSRFVGKFQGILRSQARRQIDYIRRQTASQFALTAFSSLVAGILMLVGISLFHITAAILTTLVAIIARMSGPVEQIQLGAQQLVHALPAYEKIKGLEAELASHRSGQIAAMSGPYPDGPIVFHGVSFVHSGEGLQAGAKRGVSDLNLTIASGEFLGITGPSGAGKTTFADLLVGLFVPQSGLITAGGKPLDAHLLPLWRKSLSYVSQDSFLFHETVRGNLAWSCPEASDGEIWMALRLTGAEAVVRRMDKGLDTVVGERGTLVSGGERQRLALAGAILRKPKLLVLDEATNAIDIASEQVILGHLRGLIPPPTMIMIAHRAESLRLCERVVRLESSRIDVGQTMALSS
jgi:ATP-binding cassette subfamily C protein